MLTGGWYTPLKNDGVSNSWDYELPNIWKKMFQNKAVNYGLWYLVNGILME